MIEHAAPSTTAAAWRQCECGHRNIVYSTSWRVIGDIGECPPSRVNKAWDMNPLSTDSRSSPHRLPSAISSFLLLHSPPPSPTRRHTSQPHPARGHGDGHQSQQPPTHPHTHPTPPHPHPTPTPFLHLRPPPPASAPTPSPSLSRWHQVKCTYPFTFGHAAYNTDTCSKSACKIISRIDNLCRHIITCSVLRN